jgi:hypothetical protein
MANIRLIDRATWDGGKQSVFAMFPKEKSVSGIGDDAYTFMEGIVFHKGKVEVSVITTGYLGAKPKADIAKHIAEQLNQHLRGSRMPPASTNPSQTKSG